MFSLKNVLKYLNVESSAQMSIICAAVLYEFLERYIEFSIRKQYLYKMRRKISSTKHVDNARTRIVVEYFREGSATLVRVRRISRYPDVRECETLSGWRTVLLCDTHNAQRATTLHSALMCRVDAASHDVIASSQRWQHAHCRAVEGSVHMPRYNALYAELCDVVRESMELSGVTNPNAVDAIPGAISDG